MPSPPSTSTVRAAGPWRLGDVHRAPAVGEPALGVGERPGGVAAVRLGGVHAELQGVRVPAASAPDVNVSSAANGRHRPPHHVQLARPVPYVRDGPQGGRVDVDRGLAAARGRRPGRLQELLRGRHQVRGPRPHPLRVAHDGHRALGQHVEQQLHVVDQDRGQGLHALDGDALGDLAEQFAQLGVLPRPAAAARSRTSSVSSSSRQGGAHRPCSATSRDRWSATLK